MRLCIALVLVVLFADRSKADEKGESREVFAPAGGKWPGWLENRKDPVFGNRVTGIIGELGSEIAETGVRWGRPARHIYSSVPAWDCSDSLLAIRNAGATKIDGSGAWEWLLLDGKTFQPAGFIGAPFTEFRWWNTKQKRMLLVTSEGLIDYDPVADRKRIIESSVPLFQKYAEIGLASQGNLPNDDAEIVLLGKKNGVEESFLILFSFVEDRVLNEIPLLAPRIDYATISPKGKCIVVNGEFEAGKADRTRIFDRSGKPTGSDWDPYGTPSHYDLAVDENGREIAVGVAKTALEKIPAGSVIARDLESGEIRLLLHGGYAMHISCRNHRNPGWAFVSYGEVDPATYPPFSNELVAVRTDGSGEFHRLCQFGRVGDDYWTQPQAASNSSGTLAVFATNRGNPQSKAEAAVVETGIEMD